MSATKTSTVTEHRKGQRCSSRYDYDPRGHLVRAVVEGGQVQPRNVDAAGNVYPGESVHQVQYGHGGRLLRMGANEYRYDAHGQLTAKRLADGGLWQYRWSAAGRLIEVERPDGDIVEFGYDALGRRMRKMFRGTTTDYVWDGDELVHERVRGADGELQPVTSWVFEPGEHSPVAKIEADARYGIVSDHLGTPQLMVGEAGRIAWKAQLDVYGVPQEEVAEERQPWRWPGQYCDEETGLYYNRHRYYDPEAGRYISQDPIGLLGGLAAYGYVHDPLGCIDPVGLTPRVHPIANDYISKGVHVSAANGIELRALPTHQKGVVVWKTVFSADGARSRDVLNAIKSADDALANSAAFRKQLHRAATSATKYLVDMKRPAKSAETRFLKKALEKLDSSLKKSTTCR